MKNEVEVSDHLFRFETSRSYEQLEKRLFFVETEREGDFTLKCIYAPGQEMSFRTGVGKKAIEDFGLSLKQSIIDTFTASNKHYHVVVNGPTSSDEKIVRVSEGFYKYMYAVLYPKRAKNEKSSHDSFLRELEHVIKSAV